MGQCPNEVKVDPPEAFVGVREPAWKELKELVKKARPESVLEPIGYHTLCIRGTKCYVGSYGSFSVQSGEKGQNRNAVKRLRDVLYRMKRIQGQ